METWDVRYPEAGSTGLPFARGRLDPTDVLWVHAAPTHLSVTGWHGSCCIWRAVRAGSRPSTASPSATHSFIIILAAHPQRRGEAISLEALQMRIAQVAPPVESVPPAKYGGTERVVSLLTEALVRRGHDVTLFASGDSTTRARLVPTVDTALWRLDEVRDPLPYWTITLGEVYRRARDGEFDVIHSHLDFLAFPCAALVTTPTITTLHGRLDLPDLDRLFARFPEAGVVAISKSQRAQRPGLRWVGTVHNGVDVEQLTFNPSGGEYLVFLGRISPEKGLDRAIRIARMAGLPLKVAARPPLKDTRNPQTRADWEYYDGVVQPLLRHGHVEMIGEIGDAEKPALLGQALALLFPIDWPEPFGLVMAEALACGTPVVARKRGAVPEVITHGVTGLIGETDEELARLCQAVHAIDRKACRDEAVERFSPDRMARAYEAILAREAGFSVLEEPVEPALPELVEVPARPLDGATTRRQFVGRWQATGTLRAP